MIKGPKINVYINTSKPFYYPGDKFSATILIDVQEKVNCNKMTVIAKGKEIITASQANKFENEDKPQQYESSSSSSSGSDDDNPKYRRQNLEEGPVVEIKEKKNIFKVEQEINISQNKVLMVGKYSFPFDLELPNDIPGTFLYLEKKIYAEVAYSIKVKLEIFNIKKIVPIIIRQKEEVFNYQHEHKFERKVYGCCCIVGQTSIKLTATENFTKAGDPVKLMVNINNETNTTSTPITVEIYRKLLLKGKGNKKIRDTKIVGGYRGKRIINAREKYQKKLHIAIEPSDHLKLHINETKAAKSFKHKEIIPFLFQSIKTETITCEFDVYAESQYANITNDDLGVFLTVLVYPIEDGVISKSVMNIAKAFVSGIINKKFFLKGENLMIKEKEEEEKNAKIKKEKPKKKRKLYEESEISEETIKFENKLASKMKKKKNDNNSDSEDEEVNLNNFKNNELNSINMNQNINNNPNLNNKNNYPDGNNKIKDSKNINSEDISFGTSSKEKNYFANDQISNIKKDFNKKFLNDPLDEQLSDDEK